MKTKNPTAAKTPDTVLPDIPPDMDTSISEKHTTKNIPIIRILALQKKRLSHAQIAKLVNCHPSNVSRRLHDHKMDMGSVQEYDKIEKDLIQRLQSKLLLSITDAQIKKSSLMQILSGFGILFDKRRLLEGKSTGNVSLMLSLDDATKAAIAESAAQIAANKAGETAAESVREFADD